jgi:hypothetical protein
VLQRSRSAHRVRSIRGRLRRPYRGERHCHERSHPAGISGGQGRGTRRAPSSMATGSSLGAIERLPGGCPCRGGPVQLVGVDFHRHPPRTGRGVATPVVHVGVSSAMARIRSFTKVNSSSSLHPTETDAEWSVILADDAHVLQISTFGSDVRASRPKVSQTLQFDRESAALLKAAIDAAFPGI